LEYIQTAVAKDAKPLYREQEGHTFFAMQRYAEAQASYSLVNQTDQATAATLYAEAQAYRLDKKPEEALAMMDSVIARYSTPYVNEAGPYFYERGSLKAEMGKHREAVQDFNEFEHILGGRVSANFYWEREQSEAACRMYQQALDDIDRAVKMAPNDADFWVEKGSLSLRVNRRDEAISALRQAIALDDNHATAHRILGYALTLDKKSIAEARQHLQRAKELGDDQAEGLLEKYCK
jgi:tetratricopeptide (TPR) repeat protein